MCHGTFLVYWYEKIPISHVSNSRCWYGRLSRDMININIINEEEENVGESGGYIHHTCGIERVKALVSRDWEKE